MDIKFLCIIAGRMTSTRLPGKCMKEICGIPMIEWVLRAGQQSIYVNKSIIAITNEPENKPIFKNFDNGLDNDIVEVVECKTEDVLTRFYHVAMKYKPENIVRITSDCPLLYFYPEVIDECISCHIRENNDYTWNRGEFGMCSGLDVEVFTMDALIKTYENAIGEDRQHVCPYMRKNPELFKFGECKSYDAYHDKWSVDTIEDFNKISDVFNLLRRK